MLMKMCANAFIHTTHTHTHIIPNTVDLDLLPKNRECAGSLDTTKLLCMHSHRSLSLDAILHKIKLILCRA